MNIIINNNTKERKEYTFEIKTTSANTAGTSAFIINGKAVNKEKSCGVIARDIIYPDLDTIRREREWGITKKILEHSHGLMPYYGGKYKQSTAILNRILEMQLECQKTKFVSLFHGGMSIELGVSSYKACLGFDRLVANDGDRGTHLIAYCIQKYRDRFVEVLKERMEIHNDESKSQKYTNILNESIKYLNEHTKDSLESDDSKVLYAVSAYIATTLSRDNMTTKKAVFNEHNKMCIQRLETINNKIENRFERENQLLKSFKLHNDMLADKNLYDLVRKATGKELFFLDPPYTKGYEGYAMQLNQENFMYNMKSLVKKGCSVIICGYDNPLYEQKLVQELGFKKEILCNLQNSYGNVQDEYIWVYQGIGKSSKAKNIRKAG